MSPPIVSPYKKWFCVKRIIRTFLGGPKLVLSIPFILLQTLIYIIPIVIICDVNTISDYYLAWEWKTVLSGVGMLLSDITLTFLIWILKQRKDTIVGPEEEQNDDDPIGGGSSGGGASTTLFDEEEIVPSEGILRSSTWKFIAPNVNMTVCHFSAVAASAVTVLLCEAVLVDNSVHAVLKAFVIFTVCNARYSSVISAAPEVASFDPVNRRHVFYRPFYVSICALVHFGYLLVRKFTVENDEIPSPLPTTEESIERNIESQEEEIVSVIPTTVAFILAFMPLIWVSGILPPLDSLFPWLFETILSALGARSIGYTYFGTTVSLAFAVVGPLVTFILSHDPKVTLLLECLCGYLISCDTGSMPKLKASLCEDVPVRYFLQQLIKPFVTILCSILSVFLVATITSYGSSSGSNNTTAAAAGVTVEGLEGHREIYHPILASISIFLLLTTKLLQSFDVIHKGWAYSMFGLGIFSMWHGLLTVILHSWLSLELMTEYYLGMMSSSKSLESLVVVHSLNELLPCILTIRIFALSVTEPHDSTINIFATYLYQSFVEMSPQGIKSVKFVEKLFIISLIHSVGKRFLQNLRMMTIFVYATFKSSLLSKTFTAGAVCLSVPVTLLSLIVSSLIKGMNMVPLFTLPIFIIGFPRPLSFWKGIWFLRGCSRSNNTEKILPVSTSVDWTIYADAAPLLVHEFAKHCEENKLALAPGSCFIARYDDRLMFLRVLSSGWKFCYLQVKGLEIQEQTSCHYQEAAWVDEIFGKYLTTPDISHLQILLCSTPKCMGNSLQPKFLLNVPSYSESKSQIPKFLSLKGKLIFRDMFFRAFSYLWIKGNPAFQGESYRRTVASGVPLGKAYSSSNGNGNSNGKRARKSLERSQSKNLIRTTVDGYNIPPLNASVSPDMNGNRTGATVETAESIMSNESIRRASAPMRQQQHPHLKDVSKWQGSVSYPLIPGLPNLAVDEEEAAAAAAATQHQLVGLPGNINPLNVIVGSPSTSGVGGGDMIFGFGSSSSSSTTKEINNEPISPLSVLNSRIHRNGWDGLPQLWMKQCVGDAIPHNAVKARVEKVCWKAWETAFGTFDDLYEVDMARFYRLEFVNSMKTVVIQEKPEFEHIAVRAFRYATKLTLDEIYASDMDSPDESSSILLNNSRQTFPETVSLRSSLPSSSSSSASAASAFAAAAAAETNSSIAISRSEEDEKGIFLELCKFEKTFRFCSYKEVPYWMNDKAKHIVSISSAAGGGTTGGEQSILRIFNYESAGLPFAIGELSQHCVEGIWASLNIELLYLTSDDDERYSIQNNKYLLRNLCAQSAPTLGYPVYEATFRVNLFDFSLEQLSSS